MKNVCVRRSLSLFAALATLGLSPSHASDLGEMDCVIEPHMVVDLASRVDGIVETMLVERGDTIEKDQVLVKLESKVETAAVAYAMEKAAANAQIRAGKVNVDFATRREGRVASLFKEHNVSTDQMDSASTDSDLSALELEQALEDFRLSQLELRQSVQVLDRHTLRSPIDGVVVQRFLSPGESVEDQPILQLAQIDPLRVEVIVPVRAFGELEIGQRAVVMPEAPSEGSFEAKVSIVDRVADSASGTFRVRLELPNPDYALPSGLRCRVKFLEKRDVLADDEGNATVNEQNLQTVTGQPAEFGQSFASSATALPACRRIGPFGSREEADQLMRAVKPIADFAAVSSDVGQRVKHYVLLSPAQSSMDDVYALKENFRAAGLNDLQVYASGAYGRRISVGVYNKLPMAEVRREQLAKQNIDVEPVPQMVETEQFWMDVESAHADELTAGLASLAPSAGAASVACDSFVAGSN